MVHPLYSNFGGTSDIDKVWSVGWSVGGRLVGRSVSWLVGRSVGRSVGWLVGLRYNNQSSYPLANISLIPGCLLLSFPDLVVFFKKKKKTF